MNSGMVEWLNTAGQGFFSFALAMLVQSSVLIGLLLLVDLVLRKKVRAVFRYWLWMLVLVKLMLPTTLSLPMGLGTVLGDRLAVTIENPPAVVPLPELTEVALNAPAEPELTDVLPDLVLPPMATAAEPTALPALSPSPPTTLEEKVETLTWRAMLMMGYIFIVFIMTILLIQRSRFVSGLIGQAGEPDERIMEIYQACRKQMSVNKPIGLKVSPNMVSPAVCGLFRPTILIPAYLPSKLDPQHVRTVLLHELAHISRGDLWVNLVQTLLQIAYVYNPLLWLANTVIRRIREQAVDEAVLVALGERADEYPDTLLSVARLAIARPALSLRLIGVVESKSALARRIKHILARPNPKTAKLGLVGLIAILITAAVLLPMAKIKNRFVANLQNGLTVELVAISEPPNPRWWQPDGSFLNDGPFEESDLNIRIDDSHRVLAICAKVTGVYTARYHWKVSGKKGYVLSYVKVKGGREITVWPGITTNFPRSLLATDLLLGIATGEWKTVLRKPKNQEAIPISGYVKADFSFQTPYEENDQTIIRMSCRYRDSDIRIIAIDRHGNTHEPYDDSRSIPFRKKMSQPPLKVGGGSG